MKIIVLMGSPNRKGSTNILVENFLKGAEEAGHSCEVIEVCHRNIHPCTGCVACGYEGPCVQKDDVEIIRQKLLASDMVVFATPLYYYGMTAQLKTVVDRFCAYNSSLNSRHLKSALLLPALPAKNHGNPHRRSLTENSDACDVCQVHQARLRPRAIHSCRLQRRRSHVHPAHQ